jgi:iron-sulfur cluster repair protein YtfE (RIC family)
MQPNHLRVAHHAQLSEMMNALTAIQVKMSKVRSTFPNYYQHLQQTYNQMLLQAKEQNMMPPWMAA